MDVNQRDSELAATITEVLAALGHPMRVRVTTSQSADQIAILHEPPRLGDEQGHLDITLTENWWNTRDAIQLMGDLVAWIGATIIEDNPAMRPLRNIAAKIALEAATWQG